MARNACRTARTDGRRRGAATMISEDCAVRSPDRVMLRCFIAPPQTRAGRAPLPITSVAKWTLRKASLCPFQNLPKSVPLPGSLRLCAASEPFDDLSEDSRIDLLRIRSRGLVVERGRDVQA